MRKAIIAADNIVYLDNEARISDCGTLLKAGISAVQWNGQRGEIEYVGHAKPNETITDFSPYQPYIDRSVAAIEPPAPVTLPMDAVRFANVEQSMVEFVGNDGRILGAMWDHEHAQPHDDALGLVQAWRKAGSPWPQPHRPQK